MGKFLKTVILGAASGAAAAYFLGTEKGKEVVAKAKDRFEDYKEHPDAYHDLAKEKVTEYTNLATDTFSEYKEKWQSGEFNAENLSQAFKETVEQVKEKVNDVSQTVKDKESEIIVDIPEEEVVKEDIIIDMTAENEEVTESVDE